MKKPTFQKSIENALRISNVLVALGEVAALFLNIFSVINFKAVLIFNIIIVVLYTIFYFLLKKRNIWLTNTGKSNSIRDLFRPIILILLLSWIVLGVKSFASSREKPNSVFQRNDPHFTVLILPFDKECDYNGARYDIGKVIQRRLEVLSNKDSLNIKTHYLTDSLDLKTFNVQKADSIKKFHHADLIIYGVYSLEECEGNGMDKICFNYRSNLMKFGTSDKLSKTDYNMVDFSGLDALRIGTGQEDIDYIVYTIAGLSSLRSNNFYRAIYQFKKIKNFENNDASLISIAISFYRLNDPISSKKYLDAAINVNPNNDLAMNNMGVVCEFLKEYEKAKEFYEKATQLNPKNYLPWYNLGNYYLVQKHDFRKAGECHETAAKLALNNTYLWKQTGIAYYRVKNYKKAQECFLRSSSSDPQAWTYLGYIKTHLNEKSKVDFYFNKARVFFYKQIKENPNDDKPLFDFAIFHLHMGDFKKAVKCLEKATNINPEKDYNWAQLSEINMAEHNLANVKKYAKHALKINPHNAIALENLGGFYQENLEYSKANKFYIKAVEEDPYNDRYWSNLANNYFYLKDFDKVKECYAKALQLNPENKTARNFQKILRP